MYRVLVSFYTDEITPNEKYSHAMALSHIGELVSSALRQNNKTASMNTAMKEQLEAIPLVGLIIKQDIEAISAEVREYYASIRIEQPLYFQYAYIDDNFAVWFVFGDRGGECVPSFR